MIKANRKGTKIINHLINNEVINLNHPSAEIAFLNLLNGFDLILIKKLSYGLPSKRIKHPKSYQ
jgi:hypothetical protein